MHSLLDFQQDSAAEDEMIESVLEPKEGAQTYQLQTDRYLSNQACLSSKAAHSVGNRQFHNLSDSHENLTDENPAENALEKIAENLRNLIAIAAEC